MGSPVHMFGDIRYLEILLEHAEDSVDVAFYLGPEFEAFHRIFSECVLFRESIIMPYH